MNKKHNHLKNKNILIVVNAFLLCILSFTISANEQSIKRFQNYDNDSTLTIDYTDLTKLLSDTVLESNNLLKVAVNQQPFKTGTRIKSTKGINNTTFDANRFYFKAFDDSSDNLAVLENIKNGLLKVPEHTPLKRFNQQEQLSYWLNLYNVVILKELIAIQDHNDIEEYLTDDDSFLTQKIVTIEGIPLSLNDIQFNIVYPMYNNNPVLMYGFYQGVISSPNILKTAYYGNTVFEQLSNNAREFINSNRGVSNYSRNKERLYVSALYEQNQQLFPNFNKDLKNHLLVYIDDCDSTKIEKATSFKPKIKDMRLASLTKMKKSIRRYKSRQFIMKSSRTNRHDFSKPYR